MSENTPSASLPCDGCLTVTNSDDMQGYVFNGRVLAYCQTCFDFIQHSKSITVIAEPWGLKEARKGGFANQ